MADPPEKLVFRAKNWQIVLVYGTPFVVFSFVAIGFLIFTLEGRGTTENKRELFAMATSINSLFAVIYALALITRIGTRIELDDDSIKKIMWRGRKLGGGSFNDVIDLRVHQTYFKAPRYLSLTFENSKPLRIDAEYEKLGELVKVIEERSGKEFNIVPWG